MLTMYCCDAPTIAIDTSPDAYLDGLCWCVKLNNEKTTFLVFYAIHQISNLSSVHCKFFWIECGIFDMRFKIRVSVGCMYYSSLSLMHARTCGQEGSLFESVLF